MDSARPRDDLAYTNTLRFPFIRGFLPPFVVGCCLWAGTAQAQSTVAECATCHKKEAAQFEISVHRGAVRCDECHGGRRGYSLNDEELRRFQAQAALPRGTTTAPASFDHGPEFRGKASRKEVPDRCGNCHADVARMNPYGLRTDQLSSYWISNHGKRLKAGDDRVAVCIDCHGVHDVLRSDNPNSRTHFQKVPETCGTCHSNVDLMAEFHLSPLVVEQYKRSVHGRNVLEKGDAGSPNCATCHGNHAAAPPGYLEVGHVCGKCHKQIEEYFLASVHGRIPVMARCIGCHGKDGHRSNHEIEEASPALEQVVQAYEKLPFARGAASTDTRQRFDEAVKKLSGSVRLDTVCTNCHGKAKTDPHAIFFEKTDREALENGQTLARMLADSQFEYARIAAKVAELERGVLLLRDEKLRVEDVKTETMVLYATIHTLNVKEIEERTKKITQACQEIDASLSQKEAGLTKRRMVLAGMWVFGAVFCVLMYQKYLQLKRQYVTVHADGTPKPCGPALSRRRWLDSVVGVMGAITGIGLLWPAVAYVLPARKRGGGTERVSAGKEADWAVWDVRKVSFRGKPAAVIRTSEGFRAFSAVCTHLGCIVHWDSKGKTFQCPCHAATFDAAGQVVSGPPPKPLPEFVVQVVSGEVFVAPSAQG